VLGRKVVGEVKTYEVLIEHDRAGWWVASVPAVPGAHTQARTIDQARRRIREALALWVSDAEHAHLDFEVRLPAAVQDRVARALELREAAETTTQEAAGATERALGALVKAGLSRRDAGDVLGISRQRAQQIAESLGAAAGAKRRVSARKVS
jgi:predicted RNase H-like HicB family nuclease